MNETGSVLPKSLQQVTIQTISRLASTCTPLFNWTVQFCAGVTGGGKGNLFLCLSPLFHFYISSLADTCQGDSGGPLMAFTSTNQWVLVGVTSNGIGCAEAKYMVYITV